VADLAERFFPAMGIDVHLDDYRMMTDNVRKNGASNVDLARLERSLQAAGKAFELKTIPSAAEIYTDRYLPPRAELRIGQ
jgi:hypothetical protein